MADVPPKSPLESFWDSVTTVLRPHASAPLRHSTLTPTLLNTSEASSPIGDAGDVVSAPDSAPAMHAGVPILEQFRNPPAALVPSAAQHSPLPPSSPPHSDPVFASASDDASVSRQHVLNPDDSSYMPYHHSSEPTLSTSISPAIPALHAPHAHSFPATAPAAASVHGAVSGPGPLPHTVTFHTSPTSSGAALPSRLSDEVPAIPQPVYARAHWRQPAPSQLSTAASPVAASCPPCHALPCHAVHTNSVDFDHHHLSVPEHHELELQRQHAAAVSIRQVLDYELSGTADADAERQFLQSQIEIPPMFPLPSRDGFPGYPSLSPDPSPPAVCPSFPSHLPPPSFSSQPLPTPFPLQPPPPSFPLQPLPTSFPSPPSLPSFPLHPLPPSQPSFPIQPPPSLSASLNDESGHPIGQTQPIWYAQTCSVTVPRAPRTPVLPPWSSAICSSPRTVQALKARAQDVSPTVRLGALLDIMASTSGLVADQQPNVIRLLSNHLCTVLFLDTPTATVGSPLDTVFTTHELSSAHAETLRFLTSAITNAKECSARLLVCLREAIQTFASRGSVLPNDPVYHEHLLHHALSAIVSEMLPPFDDFTRITFTSTTRLLPGQSLADFVGIVRQAATNNAIDASEARMRILDQVTAAGHDPAVDRAVHNEASNSVTDLMRSSTKLNEFANDLRARTLVGGFLANPIIGTSVHPAHAFLPPPYPMPSDRFSSADAIPTPQPPSF